MKTYVLLDAALLALVGAVVLQLLVVMANQSSLSLLTALPREFMYLKGLAAFLF